MPKDLKFTIIPTFYSHRNELSNIFLNMLSEVQKKNLSNLLQHANFEHLRPSPEVYEVNYQESDHFQPTSTNDKKRRIFYGVKYQIEQEAAIFKIKKELKKIGITEKISDEVILKHVYGGNWDIDKIIDRLKQVIDYNSNQKIVKLTKDTLTRLENGQVYTFGHDRGFRPNVYMRIDKFDLNLQVDQQFNSIYYLMLVVLGYRMVPYHAEKYNLILDLNDISLTKIPYKYMFTALEKLGIYYCGNTEKTFVYNAEGVGHIWKMISFFLPQSQKRRVIFIPKGEQSKILEYIDEYELESKYGGKLADLTQYWPPKNTNESFDMKMKYSMTESQFLSIQNDQEFFKIQKEQCFCGEPKCQCTLF